jgi:DNA-binding CsgD family transcriptional regulator
MFEPLPPSSPSSPSSTIVLSSREAEMLTYIGNGYTNPEIAEAEFISEGTVKTHCRSLYIKLGLCGQDTRSSRIKAALISLQTGFSKGVDFPYEIKVNRSRRN